MHPNYKVAYLDFLVYSFGINHDGIENSCSRSGFMMASDGGYNSVDLTWSPCSSQQLLTFFRWVNLSRVINPADLKLLN